jgi:dephospho-CoA kinase
LTAKIIGVTGAIAGGKSTVAGMLQELGAALISADEIARELLQKSEVKNEIEEVWGSSVFAEGGQVDRQALAEKVFADPGEVERLNAILHPPIIKRIKEEIEHLRREKPLRPIALDAALLHEAGLARICDIVILVDAEEVRRRERAKWQRGWDAKEIDRREQLQIPVKEKRLRADYVIDNNGEITGTRDSVLSFWQNAIIKNQAE